MHSLACDIDALFRAALCALYCARPLVSCTPLAALVFGIMLCSRGAVHAACAECATLLRESALCGVRLHLCRSISLFALRRLECAVHRRPRVRNRIAAQEVEGDLAPCPRLGRQVRDGARLHHRVCITTTCITTFSFSSSSRTSSNTTTTTPLHHHGWCLRFGLLFVNLQATRWS
jgi:hypothetical protein